MFMQLLIISQALYQLMNIYIYRGSAWLASKLAKPLSQLLLLLNINILVSQEDHASLGH